MKQPNLRDLQALRGAYTTAFEFSRTPSRFIFLCLFVGYSNYSFDLPKSLGLAVEQRMSDVAAKFGVAEFESIDQLYEQLPPDVDAGLRFSKPTLFGDPKESLRFWRRVDFLDRWIKEIKEMPDAKAL